MQNFKYKKTKDVHKVPDIKDEVTGATPTLITYEDGQLRNEIIRIGPLDVSREITQLDSFEPIE